MAQWWRGEKKDGNPIFRFGLRKREYGFPYYTFKRSKYNMYSYVNKLPDQKTDDNNYSTSSGIPFGRDAELHCSVLCYNYKKEILIAKRASSKRRFPNKWEFGCVQLRSNRKIEDDIIEGYKMDFGIEFSEPIDIIPFLTYYFHDEDGRIIPGIRFIAPIKNAQEDQINLVPNQHSDAKFISKDHVDSLGDNDCVEGFKYAILKAFELIGC